MSIAAVEHRDNIGVYAEVLDAQDWVPDSNATTPNASGVFTVNAPGGSLTLTLPTNYYTRLASQVPALIAAEGIPQAYMTRRHDYYCAPWETNPEDQEAVYCWLGWGYLYISLTAPSDTTVTATVTYYGSDSHSDNHLSDSSRQIDYVYTRGSSSSLVYSTPVAAGSQEICIDLATETPMRVVESLRLSFGAAGSWTIGEPTLCLDKGDAQQVPSRGAVEPHSYHKEFEHFEYRRGGMSANADGQFLEAIAWPDSSHANTLEPTGGHFDYVVGAESGLDLSNAWSLEAYLSLIERSSDAWESTYDGAAAEAAFKDDLGVWLKTPECFDLRPVNRQISDTQSAFAVAVRVAQWTTARGLHYDWNAEKIVEGQGHGWAFDAADQRRRSIVEFSKLWRRPSGQETWTEIEDLTSDGHGHWHSQSWEIVAEYDEEGAATLYEYGIGASQDDVTSIGRFACREYARLTGLVFALHLHLIEADLGPLYLTDCGSGDVGFRKRLPGETWVARGSVSATTDTDWACSVLSRSQGPNLVRDSNFGLQMRQGASHNNDWVAEKALSENYAYPDAVYAGGHWMVAAYKDGKQWLLRHERFGDYDFVDAYEIGTSGALPACLCIPENLAPIYCCIDTGDGANVYASHDLGRTWESAFQYAEWAYPRLYAFWGNLWLLGFVSETNDDGAAGQVYMTRRDLGSSSLAAWPFADGSTEAVVGGSDRGRSGFVSRWNKPALVVVSPKLRAWSSDTGETPTRGFVQYESGDYGMSWTREGTYSHD